MRFVSLSPELQFFTPPTSRTSSPPVTQVLSKPVDVPAPSKIPILSRSQTHPVELDSSSSSSAAIIPLRQSKSGRFSPSPLSSSLIKSSRLMAYPVRISIPKPPTTKKARKAQQSTPLTVIARKKSKIARPVTPPNVIVRKKSRKPLLKTPTPPPTRISASNPSAASTITQSSSETVVSCNFSFPHALRRSNGKDPVQKSSVFDAALQKSKSKRPKKPIFEKTRVEAPAGVVEGKEVGGQEEKEGIRKYSDGGYTVIAPNAPESDVFRSRGRLKKLDDEARWFRSPCEFKVGDTEEADYGVEWEPLSVARKLDFAKDETFDADEYVKELELGEMEIDD